MYSKDWGASSNALHINMKENYVRYGMILISFDTHLCADLRKAPSTHKIVPTIPWLISTHNSEVIILPLNVFVFACAFVTMAVRMI